MIKKIREFKTRRMPTFWTTLAIGAMLLGILAFAIECYHLDKAIVEMGRHGR